MQWGRASLVPCRDWLAGALLFALCVHDDNDEDDCHDYEMRITSMAVLLLLLLLLL